MPNRYCVVSIAAFALLSLFFSAAVPEASASDITVFEKTYIRETQKPQVFIDKFTFFQPGSDFLLTVKNGKNGSYRVSAALIWINGKQIIGVSDFNNQVDLLTRPVALIATNEIKVELRSKPGDFITINILGLGINTPPIADAGADQTVLVGDTVTLNGSASTDADGDSISYAWSFVSRPSGSAASLSNPALVNPTFQVDKPGTYVVQLLVNDGETDSAPDTVSITTANSPPFANAGPDQSIHAGSMVTLDGSGSGDVDGDLLSFAWSFFEKPADSKATLSDAAGVGPTFIADLPGNYILQLTVNDGQLNSEPDTVTISAANSAPVANAGDDQSVPPGATVTLDGSASSDMDGDPLAFSWSLLSAPDGSMAVLSNPVAVKPTFIADKPGTYIAQLIVNDGLATSSPDTVVITTSNTVPIADAGPDQSVFVGETVTLDGSNSRDADGDPLKFFWSLISKSDGSAAVISDPSAVKPTFKVDKPGDYIAQLIVNDGKVDSAPDTVTISTKNSPPVADAGPDQTVFVAQTVTLDGSASSDVDGDLLVYTWSLLSMPDGSKAVLSDTDAVKPTFVVDKPGVYVAQLVVHDGTVDSAPDTVTVTTQNSPPVADAGQDQTVYVTDEVILDGSGSSDVDGDLLTFTWSLTAKPAASAAVLSDASAVHPTFIVDKPGTYTAQLIVNDGSVDSPPDTVTVTTQNSSPVADAGPDQTVSIGQTVTLDGSASSDVDGDVLTYFWAMTSKPAGSTAELTATDAVNPTFVSDFHGDYVIQLIVNDGQVDSSPETVTVSTINSRPVANAGDDQSAIVGTLVTLDGSASSDADGDPLSYSWSITTKPDGSAAVLSHPMSVQASVTPDLAGDYLVQLIVSDGMEYSDPDTANITVSLPANQTPIAVSDAYTTDEDATLIIGAGNGVLSNDTDPDGSAMTAVLASNPTNGLLTFNTDGSFVYTPSLNWNGVDSFSYVATDGSLSSNVVTVTITVQSMNDAPMADAGENQNVATGATVQLDGSASNDPEGDALTYLWTLTSKPEGSTAVLSSAALVNPTFVADKAGSYQASLVVNDGAINSAPDAVTIEAVTVNQSPAAQDVSVETADDTPTAIILKGSDPDGDPLTFSTITAPAHGTLSGAPPIITYTAQSGYLGSDSFVYQADDGKGGTDTATVTVNVCLNIGGLAAYYPFSGTANDESGNANHGTVYGATAAMDRAGNSAGAYLFDGTSSYIQVPAHAALIMASAMTIDVWINPTGSGSHIGGAVLAKEGEYLLARFADGTIRSIFGGINGYDAWDKGGWINTGYVAPLYQWTHIVVVFNAGLIKTYANGNLIHTFDGSGSIRDVNTNSNNIRIGGRELYNMQFFDGIIDEIRIYNRALAEQEVMCAACTTSNKPPIITSTPLTAAGIGQGYAYRVIASDPDGDSLNYSLLEAPAGMTIDAEGVIRWTPGALSDSNISIQVSDEYGGSDTQSFWIRLTPVDSPPENHAPIAHAGDDFTMDEDKQDQLDGSHSFDADGDNLTYLWTQTAGPSVELDSYTIQKPRFTAPLVDTNTLLTFELVVNDGLTSSAAAKVNVMVLNMDIWPDGSGMVTNCNANGPGSLKAAVDYANAHPGTRITFGIPDTDSCYEKNTPGVWTLAVPVSILGSYTAGILINADGTFIDGASQTENQGDRNPYGPEIEITENNVSSWPFVINANDVVVRGLVINRQPYMGYHSPPLRVGAGKNGVIVGNYIGTDATGTIPLYNYADDIGEYGLLVENWAINDYSEKSLIQNLRIGGARQGEGNLISSFFGPSIDISTMYDGPPLNQPLDAPGPVTIQGNLIGVDRTGTRLLVTNMFTEGIDILHGKDVTIGGSTPEARNIIGATWDGIQIGPVNTAYPPLGNISIQGNYLGTDITGTMSLDGALDNHGIVILPVQLEHPLGTEWIIGGSIHGSGNLVVTDQGNGIHVGDDRGAIPSIKVQGNFVGTDASGTMPLGAGADGITIQGGRVLVGGTGQGEGNVVGNQIGSGIVLLGVSPGTYFRTSLLDVKGNRVGIGADGMTPIPNRNGVSIATGFAAMVGGTEPGSANTIAFNNENGVLFVEWYAGNDWRGYFAQVLGNRIFDNGIRGIIRSSGALNDPGDADLGWPLYRQNYPTILTADVAGGATQISGMLDTQSPEQCLIEVFANRVADASGFGEGENWIAAFYPEADGSFGTTIPLDLSGMYLAATATRMIPLNGAVSSLNSSEFSKAILVGSSPSANLPPAIISSPITSATTETAYSYQVEASDPEGKQLRYALALAPGGMSIDAAGLISWTPAAQQTGSQVVTVVAYDPEGLYGSQNFAIRTEPLIDTVQPVIAPLLPSGLTISTPYQVTGTICDSHIVGYSIEVAPAGTDNFILMASGDSCVENGVLGTIDPTRLANGTYVVRFTAWDESGNLTVFSSMDPIEVKGKLKIGQFSLAFQDISIPVSGIPINVIRSYNSFNKNQGDFGTGWDLALGTGVKIQVTRDLSTDWRVEEDFWWGSSISGAWSYKLVTDRVPKVLITYADGTQDRFEFKPDLFRSTEPPYPALDPRYASAIYVPLEGTTSTLEAVADTDLFVIDDRLYDLDVEPYNPTTFKLTRADGMVLMLSKTEGLKSITDRNGNTVTFSPTGIAHSAGLDIDMQRDFKNRVTKITDPMGHSVSYFYNANDDLASFTDQSGNITKFGYDTDHNLTSIIDPRGLEILEVAYDAEGRMIGSVDGLGKTTEVIHDTANAIEYVRDRRGNLTSYEYDSDGNVITETDPLGNITRFTYDANGNELSRTDPLGNTWTFTYDDKDNKLSETDPLGNTRLWTYNSTGDVLTETDANGNIVTNTYDSKGNLITMTVASGAVFTFAYDSAGNVVSLTDHYGKVTLIENDGLGHITKMTDAIGRITDYAYDGNGNRTGESTTRTTDSGAVAVNYTTQYNSISDPVLYRDPEGKQITLEYNSIGQISAKVDRNGNRFEYTYNANGQHTKTRYPDATEKSFSVDAEGNRLSETDRGGRITRFEYDATNRLIKTIFADGHSKRVEYDAAGRVHAEIDENGHRTEYAYDSAGRRTKIIDQAGHETLFTYDGNGNQLSVTDPNGNTTAYQYNALNQLVKTTFPDGSTSTVAYDILGRKISETDQAGVVTAYENDPVGRLTKVIDALGGEMAYEYDEIDNKISQTDPNGHITRWQFDSLGRALKRILPLGMQEAFTYDGRGNMLTKTNFKGEVISYAYDGDSRLTSIGYPDGSSKTFAYNPTGTRKTAADAGGTINYAYDVRDRLISVVNPDGKTITYNYDAKGNRASVTTPSGTTAYTFNSIGRLWTVTDPDGGITEHEYDAAGNLVSTTLPNGITTTRNHDSLNRLLSLDSRKPGGELVASYAYTLAPNGNQTRVEEGSGRVVNYTYDALSRLVQEEISDPPSGSRTIGYAYDAFGNRLTKNDSATGGTNYAYDENDRLLTEAAPGGATTYSYDQNGNLMAKTRSGINTLYGHSPDNRLLEMNDGSTQMQYTYDPDGLRVRSVKNGTLTVNHLLDKVLPYAQVVQQTDGSGTELANYVYGAGLISMKRPETGTRYFAADYLGSTRKLTDSAEAISDSYDYDAFGNMLQSSGTTANEHLYAGEQYDPELAMYYLRARYYDPATGRFAEIDPAPSDEFRPLSANRYIYAGANPVMNIDPSGLVESLPQHSITAKSAGVLRGCQQVQYRSGFLKQKVTRAIRMAFLLGSLGGGGYGIYSIFGGEDPAQKKEQIGNVLTRKDILDQIESP